jgi:hypothetical protein
MEQALLLIVSISGFSGFMLGLYSLLAPSLRRRGFSLPWLRAAAEDDVEGDEYAFEFDEDDDVDTDVRHFRATSFRAGRTSLLSRRGGLASDDDDEDASDFLGDFDLASEGGDDQDEELEEMLQDVEVDPALAGLEDGEQREDDEGEFEDEGDYDEEGPAASAVHIVTVGGDNDDMLALFADAEDANKTVHAWREDVPETSIEDLLAEARSLSALLKGKRPAA